MHIPLAYCSLPRIKHFVEAWRLVGNNLSEKGREKTESEQIKKKKSSARVV
jgi:hypothetical protein